MTDLTQTPKQIAVNLINAANGTTFVPSDVSLSTPTLNTSVSNGLNTSITLSVTGATQTLKVDLQYNRLDFKTLLARPYCQLEENNLSRLVDLIPYLNAKYQLALTSVDIVDGPYRPDTVATGVKKLTISVADNHLVYTGSVTIYIGTVKTVAAYFDSLQYQVGSDYSTLSFMGGKYTLNGNTVVDIQRTLVQRTNIAALYLAPNGIIRQAATYQTTTNQLVARFKNNRLCEILGLNGETSYDNTGAILPKVPTIPAAIAAIPETLGISATLNAGKLTYGLTFNTTSKRATTGTVYYVDGKNGNDTNDGSTEALAFKSFRRALNALPACRVIRVKGYSDVYYDADIGWTQTVRSRTLDIVGYGDVNPTFTSTRKVTTWSPQVTNVWFTDSTEAAAVVDKTVLSNGGYGRMAAKSTLAEVTATPHSYYIDNTLGRVYVHLTDNRQPDSSVLLVVKALSGSVADKSIVFMENCQFDLSYNGFIADMTIPKTYGYLYMNNCTFGWTFKGPSFGSYGFNVASQYCQAEYGYSGGFYYSSDRVLPTMGVKYWVIENSAVVAHCGFDGVDTSSASRIATNGTILRINSAYSNCDGDHVLDSGEGTFSLNIACSSANINNTLNTLAHYAVGLNAVNGTRAQYWSCQHDVSGFSYLPKGTGKIALFDSDIGAKPAINILSPYQFLYTA